MQIMKKKFFAVTLMSCLCAAACVQPVQYKARDDAFTRQAAVKKAWKKIAVLPFTGDLAYRRVAGEWFAFQLDKLHLFEVVGPAVSDVELRKQGIEAAESDFALEAALKAGHLLGADAVLVGSVKIKEWQGPVAGASLIDVSSSKVVATSIHSVNTMLTTSSQKQSVAAAEAVVRDISDVLLEIAGKPRPQPRQEPSQPDEQKMPWSR
jgi:hypothetical protein